MAVKMLITMSFLAAALLVAGCGSDATPTAVVDTMPPAVPTGLAARSVGGLVTLTWAPNTTDADLAGFRVERVSDGQTTVLVSDPQTECCLTDAPPQGASVYRVTAVDQSGNASAWATTSVSVTIFHLRQKTQ